MRGVRLPDLLAGGARLFAEGGEVARRDPASAWRLSQPCAAWGVE